jgi:hypothetical protein
MKKLLELIKPLNLWKFILANIGLALVIFICLMSSGIQTSPGVLYGFIWIFFICITQWTGLIYVSYLIDLKINWIDRPILRTFVGIISLVGYSLSAFMLVEFGMYLSMYKTLPQSPVSWFLESGVFTLIISFFMSIMATAAGFFKAWKTALIKAEKFKAEMMAYKYESLRNQINPHFLFNSFNVLSDLVYANQEQAVKFIQQMSGLFRYVLDSRDKELVPLKDEVIFIHSYIYLLKIRFEEKIQFEVELQTESDEFIVPMTLQLLVENAVKHNEVSEKFPLTVSIRKKDNYIEVENTLQLKKVREESNRTGIKNIEQQFAFFTDHQIEITKTDKVFSVRVPILNTDAQ